MQQTALRRTTCIPHGLNQSGVALAEVSGRSEESVTRALAKLKGVNIASVGWGAAAPPIREPGAEERDLRFIEDPAQTLATRFA